MTHDDSRLTAFALGELDEDLQLDADTLQIARQTALIARILTTQLKKPRRRLRLLPQAIAASLVVLLLCSPARQLAIGPSDSQPLAAKVESRLPILRLTPAVAEALPYDLLANTVLKGELAVDVEQLVAAVLQDASRIGTFSPLRLSGDWPESIISFQ